MSIVFRLDDLSGADVQALIALHLAGMHESSPPESVHALGIEKLRASDVSFWSAWSGDELVGCGALKRLSGGKGEIKSMRVVDAWLGKGVGRAILRHIMSEAKAMGLSSLWLETGSPEPFWPARRLYESEGFAYCGPFEGYTEDPFSVFMTRAI